MKKILTFLVCFWMLSISSCAAKSMVLNGIGTSSSAAKNPHHFAKDYFSSSSETVTCNKCVQVMDPNVIQEVPQVRLFAKDFIPFLSVFFFDNPSLFASDLFYLNKSDESPIYDSPLYLQYRRLQLYA